MLEHEYVIERTGSPWEAKISSKGIEIGEIHKGMGADFVLKVSSDGEWILSPRVHGEIRPFSMSATRNADGGGKAGISVFTIRDSVFLHGGKYYMLTNAAEGRPLKEYLTGRKYICRLENASISNLEDVDQVTKTALRKYRGIAVGELEGLGTRGHRVKLSEELIDVGLPLAAASYLLFASA